MNHHTPRLRFQNQETSLARNSLWARCAGALAFLGSTALGLAQTTVVGWGTDAGGTVPAGASNVVAIAAGGGHSLALRSDGTVAAWGSDYYGAVSGVSNWNNISFVDAGEDHSLALRADGTVLACGQYYNYTNSVDMFVPPGLSNVIAIAAGGRHNFAFQADGTVVGWGENRFGQAELPAGLTNITALSGGLQHSLALKADGTVVAWGANNYYQTRVPSGLSNVVAISAGSFHNLALRADGTVAAWGGNNYGESVVPPGLSNVVAVEAANFHSMALLADGSVLVWGDNRFGQTNMPSNLGDVIGIAGGRHGLALTGAAAPAIPCPVTDRVAYTGEDIRFVALATGRPKLRYAWRLNGTDLVDGGRLFGASIPVLAITDAETSDSGVYSLVVTNGYGSVTNTLLLTVLASAPVFTAQPGNRTNVPGSTAVFRATARGSIPLTYHWRFNGTDMEDGGRVSGTGGNTLTVTNVQASDIGDYTLVVSNLYGSATSSVAVLMVRTNEPFASILAEFPFDGTLEDTSGFNNIFEATNVALVNRALYLNGVYEWASGATNGYRAIAHVPQLNCDSFTVSVDLRPDDLSEPVPLLVGGPFYRWLELRTGWDRTLYAALNYGAISIPCGSTMILSGRWQRLTTAVDLANHSARVYLNGQLLGAVVLPADFAFDLGSSPYYVQRARAFSFTHYGMGKAFKGLAANLVVLNRGITDEEAAALPWPLPAPPVIETQPVSRTNVLGSTAWFGVVATGAAPLSYQWRFGGAELAGATTSDHTIPNVQSSHAGNYSVVVSNAQGSVTSEVAVLTVVRPPQITLQPRSLTSREGTTVQFTVQASGTPPLSYQWYKDDANLSDGTRISGASTSVITLSGLRPEDAGDYTVVITNNYGSVTSQVAVLAIEVPLPLATVLDGAGLVWTTGGDAAWFGQTNTTHDGMDAAQSGPISHYQETWMGTTVTGPGVLSFWWAASCEFWDDYVLFYTNGGWAAELTGDTGWQPLQFEFGPGTHDIGWAYYKNSSGSYGQDAAWVDQVVFAALSGPPTVILEPASQTVVTGGTASFTSWASGSAPMNYQWQMNGTNVLNGGDVSGATSTNLVIAKVDAANAGEYRLIAANALGSATSSVAVLTVSTVPANILMPGLYITNAVVLPDGYAQIEVRTPDSEAYGVLYSADLEVWDFWTKIEGDTSYTLQTPVPISAIGPVFLRVAPLGQATYRLSLEFRNSWNSPLVNGAPVLDWPQPFQSWQPILNVANCTNFPSPAAVFLTPSSGSGLVTQQAEYGPDPGYGDEYEFWIWPLPPGPPLGNWRVDYGGTPLTLNLDDPQLARHAVTVVPSFVVSNGYLQSMSWTYRDPASGSVLPIPAFIQNINLDIYGPDYSLCGADDYEIFETEFPTAGVTNHVFDPPLPWENPMVCLGYEDVLHNFYTMYYSFGNLYEVFGANWYVALDYCDPYTAGFTKLGEATGTATFSGSYNYYLVRVPKHNVGRIDAVQGSTGAYFSSNATGNVSDLQNLGGPPDGKYAVLGVTARGFYTGGLLLIDARNAGLTSLTVFTVP